MVPEHTSRPSATSLSDIMHAFMPINRDDITAFRESLRKLSQLSHEWQSWSDSRHHAFDGVPTQPHASPHTPWVDDWADRHESNLVARERVGVALTWLQSHSSPDKTFTKLERRWLTLLRRELELLDEIPPAWTVKRSAESLRIRSPRFDRSKVRRFVRRQRRINRLLASTFHRRTRCVEHLLRGRAQSSP